jgi:hypothetical protein
MVRERGLEPPHLAAHAPKACVSTIPPLARGTTIIPPLGAFLSLFLLICWNVFCHKLP